MAIDFEEICEDCGKDYGWHYGDNCVAKEERTQQSTKFEPVKSHAVIYGGSMVDRAINPPTRKRQHNPSGPWIMKNPMTESNPREGALNMCKDTGMFSVCTACGNFKDQQACAFFTEATHEVRCMYISHGEYCGCIDAQARAI